LFSTVGVDVVPHYRATIYCRCGGAERSGVIKDGVIRAGTGRQSEALPGCEQISNSIIVIHRHVQVDARDDKIRVTCGDANLGQRSSAGKGVADKSVPAVVNGKRAQPTEAQNLARRQEAPADGSALERLAAKVGLYRTNEGIVAAGALRAAKFFPCGEVR
jgi:hypothetical protein